MVALFTSSAIGSSSWNYNSCHEKCELFSLEIRENSLHNNCRMVLISIQI